MTWHLATNHITSPHVTSQPTALLHRSLQPTTSKQVTTSPPWNGWRLVHSNNSVWASPWLVTLCTFYRQILSLTYSFFLLKLPPPACPALLVHLRNPWNQELPWVQPLDATSPTQHPTPTPCHRGRPIFVHIPKVPRRVNWPMPSSSTNNGTPMKSKLKP